MSAAHRTFVAMLALGSACGGAPAPIAPVAEEFIEVAYPPPPAQIEEIDERLAGRPECSWADGFYEWRGRRWQWQHGAWVIAPAGCTRTPARLMWSKPPNARLYYTPPRWYRADGKSPCAAPIPCEPEHGENSPRLPT